MKHTSCNNQKKIGLKEVAQMNESFAIKRSHMLNFITRNGASIANTFGSITLVYSAIGVGLSFVQDENDDINTMIAATTTGTLYGAISRSKAMDNVQGNKIDSLKIFILKKMEINTNRIIINTNAFETSWIWSYIWCISWCSIDPST